MVERCMKWGLLENSGWSGNRESVGERVEIWGMNGENVWGMMVGMRLEGLIGRIMGKLIEFTECNSYTHLRKTLKGSNFANIPPPYSKYLQIFP